MLVLIDAIHSKSKTPAPGAEAPFANSQNMGQEEPEPQSFAGIFAANQNQGPSSFDFRGDGETEPTDEQQTPVTGPQPPPQHHEGVARRSFPLSNKDTGPDQHTPRTDAQGRPAAQEVAPVDLTGASDKNTPPPAPSRPSEDPKTAAYNKLYYDIWANNDQGSHGMAAVSGTACHLSSAILIMMALMPLLPVDLLAPRHSTWNKSCISSLSMFVETLKTVHPDLYKDIMAVATLQGIASRDALRKVTYKLFGSFGSVVHASFLYAVMLFVWSSTDSPKAAQIYSLLLAYFPAKVGELDDLKAACREPNSPLTSPLDMAKPFLSSTLKTSLGWKRLNPRSNTAHFCSHWATLWECACLILTVTTTPLTPSIALRVISSEGFAAQGEQESMKDFFARLRVSYALCSAELGEAKRQDPKKRTWTHLLPHPDSLVQLIFEKACKRYTSKVRDILMSPNGNHDYDERDLDLVTVEKLYHDAAKAKAKNFSAINEALNSKTPKGDDKPTLKGDDKPPAKAVPRVPKCVTA